MEVSVLGLGILGAAVAKRLAKEGFLVTAWSRSEGSRERVQGEGVQVSESAAEAVRRSPLTVLLLSDYAAIDECILSEPAASHLQGKTIIQMGTIGVSQSRHVARRVRDLGGTYMEAPVQGSQGEAAKGALQVMLGADEDDLPPPDSLADKVLSSLGAQRKHVGPVGSAAALKLSINQILAAETAAFSASLLLATRSGVPVDTFMDVLKGSALFAKQYEKKLANMTQHTYGNANFHTKHLLKDVSLFASEAAAEGINTQGVEGIIGVIKATLDAGFETSDYSSLYEGVAIRPVFDQIAED